MPGTETNTNCGGCGGMQTGPEVTPVAKKAEPGIGELVFNALHDHAATLRTELAKPIRQLGIVELRQLLTDGPSLAELKEFPYVVVRAEFVTTESHNGRGRKKIGHELLSFEAYLCKSEGAALAHLVTEGFQLEANLRIPDAGTGQKRYEIKTDRSFSFAARVDDKGALPHLEDVSALSHAYELRQLFHAAA